MEIVAPAPRGLRGVVVTDTEIGDVRGEEGFFHYRQYSAIELAATRPFDDVWQLLVDGALPGDVAERERFAADVAPWRIIPDVVRPTLPAIATASSSLDGLRTALSLVASSHGLRPVLDLGHDERRRDALAVAAVTPTLVTALHRLRHGHEPVEPRDDLGTAANLLWMLHAAEPDAPAVRALEQYLIATIDHGFNSSTFTARVVASTGADVGASVVAAIGALSGPLHGGAPSRALDLIDEIGTPDRARDVVTAKVLAGERIMGFGHAVYRTDDPRSVMLREIARHLGGPLVDLALEVERTVVDFLAELKPGRRLRTNVEFYAGVVMATCGIPREMFTPAFASSRVVGWVANVLEQAADPAIIRPSARYIGPRPPAPVPVLREPST
jgi:citrate synthase